MRPLPHGHKSFLPTFAVAIESYYGATGWFRVSRASTARRWIVAGIFALQREFADLYRISRCYNLPTDGV